MEDRCIYNCEVCGQSKEIIEATSESLECCGKTMIKQEDMPVCETTVTAEHSRFDDMGEPCDDGRGWGKEG